MQHDKGIAFCQRRYAEEVLKRFGMTDCNEVKNPIIPGCRLHRDREGEEIDDRLYKQLVGSLMYFTATKPDMMFIHAC